MSIETLENSNEWTAYLADLADRFCPFLKRSIAAGAIRLNSYSPNSVSEREEYCFAICVVHTEILRKLRKSHNGSMTGRLVCENVVFSGMNLDPPEQEVFFNWIHWALKLAYTDSGLVFGKFWPGEKFVSKGNEIVPNPPDLLVSIRSTIGAKDAQFFSVSPSLADRHGASQFNAKSILDLSDIPSLGRLRDRLARAGDNRICAIEIEEAATDIASDRVLRATIAQDAFASMRFAEVDTTP